MKLCYAYPILFLAFAGVPLAPSMAAEGAATGNGTSTPAGPAGDSSGPSKSGSMSSGSFMKMQP